MTRPYLGAPCADCGVGTFTIREWYMVKDEVWEQAWAGRRKSWHGRIPGQEILCIGCLEQRIGRTLMCCDFTDAPINDPNEDNVSERMRDRLATKQGTIHGLDGLVAWMIEGMINRLPPDKRAAARVAARSTQGSS